MCLSNLGCVCGIDTEEQAQLLAGVDPLFPGSAVRSRPGVKLNELSADMQPMLDFLQHISKKCGVTRSQQRKI